MFDLDGILPHWKQFLNTAYSFRPSRFVKWTFQDTPALQSLITPVHRGEILLHPGNGWRVWHGNEFNFCFDSTLDRSSKTVGVNQQQIFFVHSFLKKRLQISSELTSTCCTITLPNRLKLYRCWCTCWWKPVHYHIVQNWTRINNHVDLDSNEKLYYQNASFIKIKSHHF